MRINNNLMAMNTHRQLGITNNAGSKSMEKLSSGYRINRAGDDAAGLAISEKMRNQIRGLNQASRNAQDGISLIQTAEGALNETHAMVQRMRELAVQANNDTNTSEDLGELQKEITQLNEEITRIASKTEFNTKTLLDGSLGVRPTVASTADWTAAGVSVNLSGIAGAETITMTKNEDGANSTMTASYGGVTQTITVGATVAAGTEINFDSIGIKFSFSADTAIAAVPTQDVVSQGTQTKFQIGANQDTVLEISISDMRANSLGTGVGGGGLDNISQVNVAAVTFDFDNTIEVIDKAISQVSSQRSQLGAYQNRLEYTIKNLDTSSENLQASESRIRDVDMAKEMMEFTKNNILTQAAQAMLAQANQAPQGVLQLLR